MGELAVAKQADDDVVEAGCCVVHGESRLVAGGGHVVLVRGNADIEVRVVVEDEIDVLDLEPRLRGAVLRPEAYDDSRSGTGDCRVGCGSGEDEFAFGDRKAAQVEGGTRALHVGSQSVVGKDDFVRVGGVGVWSARIEPGRIRVVERDFKPPRAAFD